MNFAIRPRFALSAAEAAAVRALACKVAKRDGAPPLSEDALLRLDDPNRRHLLLTASESAGVADAPVNPADIAGYAQIVDEQGGIVTEIVGDGEPIAQLLGEVEKLGRPVTIWAHGNRSAVSPIAHGRGYQVVRVLWQLSRDLATWTPPEPEPESEPLPDGVVIRPFDSAQDEQGLLEVNADAFANHPEQGRWSVEDLHSRMAQPWFDPNGLLLAVTPQNEVLGFHWTKSHPNQVGEVYVLAVSPKAQGLRLGSALLVAGLRYLVAQGAPSVSLYVDDDNTAAMALYGRYGFTRFECDTQFRN